MSGKISGKVLVVGDEIRDIYRRMHATRLCPSAPVPVLQWAAPPSRGPGGAALVSANLAALYEGTREWFGSLSEKEYLYADNQMVCRIDRDSLWKTVPSDCIACIAECLQDAEFSAIVVSDYGKGAMDGRVINYVIDIAHELTIPVFVDAKQNWDAYAGAFAVFPNEHERFAVNPAKYKHTIVKLGEKGCLADGEHLLPEARRAVYDVSGAGDVFLAGYVYGYLQGYDVRTCARLANHLAGIAVEHLGTYIVGKADVEGFN